MVLSFRPSSGKQWTLLDDKITSGSTIIMLSDVCSVMVFSYPSLNNDGKFMIKTASNSYSFVCPRDNADNGKIAIDHILAFYNAEEQKRKASEPNGGQASENILYDLKGVRGRSMKVYGDRCVISTKASVGSFISGNVSDGEKTIFFTDCIGVQFKKSGFQIGYIQLETASGIMNNTANNFFNENSFTFDKSVQTNENMSLVADYIKNRIAETKRSKSAPIVNQVSSADELLKYKQLLDMGILTQEEFDTKKKQLLGL